MIHVTMTMKDGSKVEFGFKGWPECAAWVERRHGQYTEIEAQEVSADKKGAKK